jgi:hypothetical protein
MENKLNKPDSPQLLSFIGRRQNLCWYCCFCSLTNITISKLWIGIMLLLINTQGLHGIEISQWAKYVSWMKITKSHGWEQLFGNEDKTERYYNTKIFSPITSVWWIALVQPALQNYNLSGNIKENQVAINGYLQTKHQYLHICQHNTNNQNIVQCSVSAQNHHHVSF